jgi:hypothetical protein
MVYKGCMVQHRYRYCKLVIKMKKTVLEGRLIVEDLNEDDVCSGGPFWITRIDDKRICEHRLDEYIFEEFVGKKIRLTIEEIE